MVSWNGIAAPKGTPKDVIDTMNKAIHEVLATPELKAQFAKVGVEAHASTPAELMDAAHRPTSRNGTRSSTKPELPKK